MYVDNIYIDFMNTALGKIMDRFKWQEKEKQRTQRKTKKSKNKHQRVAVESRYYKWVTTSTRMVLYWRVNNKWKTEKSMKPSDVRDLFKKHPNMLEYNYYGSGEIKQLTDKERSLQILKGFKNV